MYTVYKILRQRHKKLYSAMIDLIDGPKYRLRYIINKKIEAPDNSYLFAFENFDSASEFLHGLECPGFVIYEAITNYITRIYRVVNLPNCAISDYRGRYYITKFWETFDSIRYNCDFILGSRQFPFPTNGAPLGTVICKQLTIKKRINI